jgi:hypothetical protein
MRFGCDGCGLAVPDIQEFPGGTAQGQVLVHDIVTNINCEVQEAIEAVYKHNTHTMLDNWGVQIALSLQVSEKGTVNPTLNWVPPSAATRIFNLNTGVDLSSEATRIDKLNSFFTVEELRKFKICAYRTNGPMLLQSDLKLKEWLFDVLDVGTTGQVNYGRNTPKSTFGNDVISHEIKFEVITGGNLTPGWKLENVSINQDGQLLAANRGRIHDLTITLGPTDETLVLMKDAHGNIVKKVVARPSQAAFDSHFASQIGLAVANSIKGASGQ